MYSNTVAARTSYTFDEIVYGAKFVSMYERSEDKTKTILDLDKLNHYEIVEVLSQGDELTFIKAEGEWLKVLVNDSENIGWVHYQYVK